ncbi:rhodanese-related sulfurtransferase [Pontibacter mucosus]|uniref:Rhodanese-related sulfurtransferase n=2 Tax=Pontibacter mucosus TaxID=1649266 RepID=A0A2T5YCK0_9BACT|nr:rhodanese-related sulfurtransferase [Pontibacter mucosus]
MLKKLPFALATAALLSACSTDPSASELIDANGAIVRSETGEAGKAVTINSHEAKALLEQHKELVVLDVRTPGEHQAGHVADALLLDYYSPGFEQRLKELDTTKPYLVYCAVGSRSRDVVRRMQQLGFEQVYEAAEGFEALKQAGVQVE